MSCGVAMAEGKSSLPIPAPGSFQRLSEVPSQEALRVIDEVALRSGARRSYGRTVLNWPPKERSAQSRSLFGSFVIVKYAPASTLFEFGPGIQVWINKQTGKYFVVDNRAIMRAHRKALELGADLTRHDWFVRDVDTEQVFTFQARGDNDEYTLDGSLRIAIDKRTYRVVRWKL